jgi:ribonucleoside-triphosphate reductase (formate)
MTLMVNQETTDITLFVKTSSEDVARWNRQRIVDALIRETDVDVETADAISKDVEKQIMSSGISLLTTPLIRELVDAKLIERGLERARRMHARLGFPAYDVKQLILHQNKENANVPHGPEGTNLLLAEGIKRDYSLHEVFSQDVADAHATGDIHLHGLGFIDRPYSSFQSLEYIKKYGLNLPHSLTVAKPAKHAEVLLAHMVRFGAILQGHFAGVIGWDAVNLSFAPYLSKMSDKEIRQFAQMLIYEFSQLTSARGGQSMFTDIHLYWEVPGHLRNVPAIGPGGEVTGGTYEDYIADARRFAWAMFEVFKKGDGTGKPFIFPRPIVHMTESFFRTPGHEDFLHHICEVAVEKGNTCFFFDRSAIMKIYECGLMNEEEKKELLQESKTPWKIRCSAIQNVSINLPRLGYKAGRNDSALFSMISEQLELTAKAHDQKRKFIEELLSYGDEGPLSMLAMNKDGLPYLRMERGSYLMGIVGLNELVQIHRGKQLHESDDALAFGLEVITYMKEETERLCQKYQLRFVLEQTPAETTTYRFARLDLKYFSPEAGHFVKGDLAKGEVYYTNSTHLRASAPVDPVERVMREGLFHSLIGGSAITHVWIGEDCPEKTVTAQFIFEAFHNSQNTQIVFSPEFTSCKACDKTSGGLKSSCPACGSANVEGIARITQYFSKVSSWNKGKIAELRDRVRYSFR